MVQTEKVSNNETKDVPEKLPEPASDPLESLEKEITQVVSACKSMISDEHEVERKKSGPESKITLETIAEDMSNILSELKFNLTAFKDKKDSFSDVLPSLEESFQMQIKQQENDNNTNKRSTGQASNLTKKADSTKTPVGGNNKNNNNTKIGGNNNNNNTNKNKPANVKSPSNTKNTNNRPVQKQGFTNSKTCPALRNSNTSKSGSTYNSRGVTRGPIIQNNRISPNRPGNTASNTARSSGSLDKRNVVNKDRTVANLTNRSVPQSSPNRAGNMPCAHQRSNTSNQSNTRKALVIPQVNLFKDLSQSPLCPLKDEVERAVKDNKTFTIRGVFPAIRRALIRRGWVEKIHFSMRDQMNTDIKKFRAYSIPELVNLVRNKEITDICKRLIKSKLLERHQVDLYYGNNYESYKECPDRVKQTLINRIRWSGQGYTSKQGLSEASRKTYWFHIPGVSNMNHPRSYLLTKNGDTEEFVKDFNLTAAMSLLKWVKTNHKTGQCKILSPFGKIPLTVFDFAVNECYKFIKTENHEDLDHDISEAMSKEWNDFLEDFYRAVHVGNHFKMTDDGVNENDLVRKASFILERLREHWPYLDMDGLMNIWILKPTNSSQGVGIHMCRTLKYVLDVVKANPNRRYVIQKYVERPMLIYNTKFDIRQWFLISTCLPLTIWIYKQCYLRFSSQTYNLRKLHESIHLTNNSVQSRYRQTTSKDITLPAYNMWDSAQFKTYLSNVGFPQAFDDIIYPGMKESITAAVLMHQDSLEKRRNSFELYGADFIVTEDFKPWLLEINSNPALYASTPITARMCPIVLEDVIKVVVDHQRDAKRNTGSFELLYRQYTPPTCKAEELQIEGTRLREDYFSDPPSISEKNSIAIANGKRMEPVACIRDLGISMRNTLENLLTVLREEKVRRLELKNRSIETILSNSSIKTETSTDKSKE